jgi:hypothetical protein
MRTVRRVVSITLAEAVATEVVAKVAVVADLVVVVAEVVSEVGSDQGMLVATWPASRRYWFAPLSLPGS